MTSDIIERLAFPVAFMAAFTFVAGLFGWVAEGSTFVGMAVTSLVVFAVLGAGILAFVVVAFIMVAIAEVVG